MPISAETFPSQFNSTREMWYPRPDRGLPKFIQYIQQIHVPRTYLYRLMENNELLQKCSTILGSLCTHLCPTPSFKLASWTCRGLMPQMSFPTDIFWLISDRFWRGKPANKSHHYLFGGRSRKLCKQIPTLFWTHTVNAFKSNAPQGGLE